MTSVVSPDTATKRATFFKALFGDHGGYVCLSKREPHTRTFDQSFFHWPEQVEEINEYIKQFAYTYDLYYCPHLFDSRECRKESVAVVPCLWSDLDTCPPQELKVRPSVVTQTSPGRFQAIWIFAEPVDPSTAEDLSRRIAYYHQDAGADKSGWDLTQRLRVPFSLNHKYTQALAGAPQIRIVGTGSTKYTLEDFAEYPEAEGYEYTEIPFPESFDKVADEILEYYRLHLGPQVWVLHNETPTQDWSKALWQLELLLAESGMTREEIFTVVRESACNKYKRDNRSERLLWKDVCKAYAKYESRQRFLPTGPVQYTLEPLLSDEEKVFIAEYPSIIEEYIEWAKTIGDAAWQYHQAGAFVILSGLLAGRVRLPTSFGTIVPNLWFMILADTTLTRKTTAMDLAMDILVEIDSDSVLATDGSIEGLMTSLSMRPGRPSVFLRDEFSGLLEALTKKDYYAGMAESLTKLYDGKFQKRVLRKEILEVRDPVLIFFAGGIRSRVVELLTPEHVASGFIPRFACIAAESDVSLLRPLGPPTERSTRQRQTIIDKYATLFTHYARDEVLTINGKQVAMPKKWDADLTSQAWSRYNDFEAQMLQAGLQHQLPELATPTMDRLSKTGLKLALLIAASSRLPEHTIKVEANDIIRAFWYVEQWREYSLDMLTNIGKTQSEKRIDAVLRSIRKQPTVTRSVLMQAHHLTARDADMIFTTLEQRGLIVRTKDGRTERFAPVG